MSGEGSIAFALILGIAIALTMTAGRKMTDELLERKGFIGFVFVCVFAGTVLWLNARIIGDYLGVATSEVQLFAILVFVVLILVLVAKNRETTTRAARLSAKATRKAKSRIKRGE